MKLLQSVKAAWKTLVIIVTPLLLCPLVFPYSQTSSESKCAALIILMAVFWITESLPLPVTALLPIALCPLLGIASSKQMCKSFFGDVIFLLLGGIIVAIAIEESKLHKRLALRILMFIGVKPRRLMLGIMLTTAFLSMWISNTATTAMMMPITRALLAKLFTSNKMVKQRLAGGGQNLLGKPVEDVTENGKQASTDEIVEDPVSIEMNVNGTVKDFYPEGEDVGDFSDLEDTTVVFTGMDGENVIALDDLADENEESQNATKRKRRSRAYSKDGALHSNKEKISKPINNNNKDYKEVKGNDDGEYDKDDDEENIFKDLSPENLALLKAFNMCVCYSANIGGIATLTGTPPNMVLSNVIAEKTRDSPISFASWFAFGLPISVITLVLSYLWMNIFVFGLRNTVMCKSQASEEEVQMMSQTIQKEYRKLGRFKFQEVVVLIHFLVLVALWLTRNPGSSTGWVVAFESNYVSDAVTAVAVAASLFIFPRDWPNVLFFRRKGDTSEPRSMQSIITWREASKKLPWGVAFLLGGGFALSKACEISGLSKVISDELMFIQYMPVWAAALVVALLTSLLTEITSNTVITMLVLPIIRDCAVKMNIHPLYFMLPVAVAASLAFMLPVATPPNALVFGYGDLTTLDMIKTGSALNVIGVCILALGVNTWGYAFFDLGTFPSWAIPLSDITTQTTNVTVMSSPYNNTTVAF